jgi:hypothetical protein
VRKLIELPVILDSWFFAGVAVMNLGCSGNGGTNSSRTSATSNKRSLIPHA